MAVNIHLREVSSNGSQLLGFKPSFIVCFILKICFRRNVIHFQLQFISMNAESYKSDASAQRRLSATEKRAFSIRIHACMMRRSVHDILHIRRANFPFSLFHLKAERVAKTMPAFLCERSSCLISQGVKKNKTIFVFLSL